SRPVCRANRATPAAPRPTQRRQAEAPTQAAPEEVRGFVAGELPLFEGLRREGFTMSFAMGGFRRQVVKEHLHELSPEDRREVVQSLPPEERLAGLPPQQILAALPPEEQEEALQALPPERRLAGLSAEQIRQYLDQLTAGQPASPRRRRRKK